MPRYLECTYVRKDLVEAAPSIKKFPTPLDHKCRGDAPELLLNFWEPCDRPVSFVLEEGTDTTLLKKIMTKEDEIVYKIEDAKWPLKFKLYTDDVFPYEIIMKLAHVPDGNIVLTEVHNGAFFIKSVRILFPNEKYMEVEDRIHRLVL